MVAFLNIRVVMLLSRSTSRYLQDQGSVKIFYARGKTNNSYKSTEVVYRQKNLFLLFYYYAIHKYLH